jgi:chorismate--pyruvate lyase
MRRGSHALIRQVQLLCGGKPWIYARTVIPVNSLRGRLKRLAHLGTRPLGGVLFADPGMRRGVVELASIRPGQALYTAATARLRTRPAAIWGRRSVFTITRRPLLVSEVFLPDFPATSIARRVWKSR